jgi:small multidrug resistance family-3 protein
MANFFWFLLAAVCEIAGCFTVWMWLRQGRSPLWVLAGVVSLVAFAAILTRVDAEFAGRAYAAYGGVYIVASLLWLSVVERSRPVLTDYVGAALCLLGATLLLAGGREW